MKAPREVEDKFNIKLRKYLNYVIIFLCFSLMFSFFQSLQRARNASLRVSTMQKRVEDLENRKQELEIRVNEAKSEEYVETQLRTKLGLAKENEIVIILPEDDVIRRFAPSKEVYVDELPDPNWKKWMKLFL